MDNNNIGITLNMKSKVARESVHDLSNSFVKLSKDGKRANTSLNGLVGSLGGLKKVLAGVGFYKLAKGISTATQTAMDSIESIHLFEVALGDLAVESSKAVDALSEISGLDRIKMLDTVGEFNLLARSMGLTNKNSQVLSKNTNQLALDLSSLTNRSYTKVAEDLRSGLIGQSKTMYKYGIDVTEAAIKQEALNQGISKSVRHMSQGEKMALRYSVMIKQSALSHGDFAKTIESPANQVRIFSERILTLTRAIGQLFLPVLAKVMPYVNAFVTLLTKMVGLIGKAFGIKDQKPIKNVANNFGSISDNVDDVGKNAGKTSKKLDKLKKKLQSLAGFDELNIINTKVPETPDTPSGGSGGVGDVGGGALDFDLGGYDNLLDGMVQKSEEIVKKLEKTFKNLFKDVDFTNLTNSFKILADAIKPFLGHIKDGLKWFLKNILAPLAVFTINELLPKFFEVLAGAIRILNSAIELFKPVASWLFEHFLKPIASWTGGAIIILLDALAKVLGFIADNLNLLIPLGAIILAWKFSELMRYVQFFTGNSGFLLLADTFMHFGSIAVSGLVLKLKSLVGWFGKLVKPAMILGKSFLTFLLSPTGLVITGIIALIAVGVTLYKHWDEVKVKAGELKEKLSQVWDDIKKKVSEKWGEIKTWFEVNVPKIIDSIVEFFKGLPKKIGYALGYIIGTLATWVSNSMSWVGTNLPRLINKIVKFFADTPTKIGKALGAFAKTLSTWVSNGVISVTKNLPRLINSIIDFFNKLPNSMVTVGKNMIKGLWNGIISVGSWLTNKMSSFFGGAWKVVKDLFSGLGSGFKVSFSPAPRLARGGQLEAGQAFVAGEAGMEMFGKHNGKQTVMPLENTSFVSAIEKAVARGISSGGNNGNNGGVVVKIGERTLVDILSSEINRQSRINGKAIIKV